MSSAAEAAAAQQSLLSAGLTRENVLEIQRVHKMANVQAWAAGCRYDCIAAGSCIEPAAAAKAWGLVVRRVEAIFSNPRARDVWKAKPDCYISVTLDQARAFIHVGKPAEARKTLTFLLSQPSIKSCGAFFNLLLIAEAQLGDAAKAKKVLDTCRSLASEEWHRAATRALDESGAGVGVRVGEGGGGGGIAAVAALPFDDFSFPWLASMLAEWEILRGGAAGDGSPAASASSSPPASGVAPALPEPAPSAVTALATAPRASVAAPIPPQPLAPPPTGSDAAAAASSSFSSAAALPHRRMSFRPASSSRRTSTFGGPGGFVSSLSPVREEVRAAAGSSASSSSALSASGAAAGAGADVSSGGGHSGGAAFLAVSEASSTRGSSTAGTRAASAAGGGGGGATTTTLTRGPGLGMSQLLAPLDISSVTTTAATTTAASARPAAFAGPLSVSSSSSSSSGGSSASVSSSFASTSLSAAAAPASSVPFHVPDYIRGFNPGARQAAAAAAVAPAPKGAAAATIALQQQQQQQQQRLSPVTGDEDVSGASGSSGGQDGTVVLQKGGARARGQAAAAAVAAAAAAPASSAPGRGAAGVVRGAAPALSSSFSPDATDGGVEGGGNDGTGTVVFQPRPRAAKAAPATAAAAPLPPAPQQQYYQPQPQPQPQQPAAKGGLDESSFDADDSADGPAVQPAHPGPPPRAAFGGTSASIPRSAPFGNGASAGGSALSRGGPGASGGGVGGAPVRHIVAAARDGGSGGAEDAENIAPPSASSPSSSSSPFDNLPSTHEVVRVGARTYLRLACIGRGGSSRVYRVLGEDMATYALKRVRLTRMDAASVEPYKNEIALLKRLGSTSGGSGGCAVSSARHIIRLVDAEVDWAGKCIHMVMECGGADLNAVLAAERERAQQTAASLGMSAPRLCVDENVLRVTWAQMLAAVHSIHEGRVVHGDLKPANFVFVEGVLKLIDFGIAKALRDDTTNIVRDAQMGTLNYMSPEAIQDVSGGAGGGGGGGGGGGFRGLAAPVLRLGRASDIWSLGCILFQMVFGRTPFADLPLIPKLHAICDASAPIPFPTGVDPGIPDLMDVLRSCLQRNPALRPPIAGPGGLLEHPFLHPRSSAAAAAAAAAADAAAAVRAATAAVPPPGSVVLSPEALQALVAGAVSLGAGTGGSAPGAEAAARALGAAVASAAGDGGDHRAVAGGVSAEDVGRALEAAADAARAASPPAPPAPAPRPAMGGHLSAISAAAAARSSAASAAASAPSSSSSPVWSEIGGEENESAAGGRNSSPAAFSGASNVMMPPRSRTASASALSSLPIQAAAAAGGLGSFGRAVSAGRGGLGGAAGAPLAGSDLQAAIAAKAAALRRVSPVDKENAAPAAAAKDDGSLAAALRRGLDSRFARALDAGADEKTLGMDATWS